ncbi:MAG: hypothetical protein OEW62_09540 [Candidatus Bathyarchaeota archaeon]|nr:hypothetical protein [Candidatus Bathyarchaeota archaeon]MDH5532113.1 hypothetical protein [Candidatus Bathyarchaeota archaeon]
MEEKILHLHDRYNLRKERWTPITIRIQRWLDVRDFRVRLSIIEGYYDTSGKIDKAVSEYGKNRDFPDYPKHFEITCGLDHMLEIAETLTEICQQE